MESTIMIVVLVCVVVAILYMGKAARSVGVFFVGVMLAILFLVFFPTLVELAMRLKGGGNWNETQWMVALGAAIVSILIFSSALESIFGAGEKKDRKPAPSSSISKSGETGTNTTSGLPSGGALGQYDPPPGDGDGDGSE